MLILLGEASWRFVGDLSPWVGAGIACGAALVVFLLYLRETSTLRGWARWGLPLLRALAVALVILILIGPVLQRRQRITPLLLEKHTVGICS